jgi:hypothetical protein
MDKHVPVVWRGGARHRKVDRFEVHFSLGQRSGIRPHGGPGTQLKSVAMLTDGFTVQSLHWQETSAGFHGVLLAAIASILLCVLTVVDHPREASLGPALHLVFPQFMPRNIVEDAQHGRDLTHAAIERVHHLFDGIAQRVGLIAVRPLRKFLRRQRDRPTHHTERRALCRPAPTL